jgi:hypothetical protein
MGAFGVDTLDPATTTRRVAVLLDRLPPSARVGGEVWSVEAELLAVLVDQVAALTWVTLRAAGAKNAKRPRPIPRPTRSGRAAERQVPAAAEPGRAGSWADAARQLAGMPGMRRDGDL